MKQVLIVYVCPYCGVENQSVDIAPKRHSKEDAQDIPRVILRSCSECNEMVVLEYTPYIEAEAFKIDRNK